jgi:hypothetical protein
MAAPSTYDRSAPSSPERPASRSSIALSLGSKDPSYFRQTADRGATSAAYRRSEDDSSAADARPAVSRRPLPGMSRDSTTASSLASPPTESTRSSSPSSRRASVRDSAVLSNRFSSTTSISGSDMDTTRMHSPLPVLESQKFAPPTERPSTADTTDPADTSRGPLMSPTQGRISPERPLSPTKGIGGFVLSASMKRSDSVSKRWSTYTPPNLSRQSSNMSNRASAMAGFGSLAKLERPTGLSRESSVEPLSRPLSSAGRPTSSSSNATITKGLEKDAAPREEPVRPSVNRHSRSKSMASTFFDKDQSQDESGSASPSKRWSPTKSSWLESALNKPESPKLKPKTSSPVQPAWMAEINRIKQQRSSVDLGNRGQLGSPFGETHGSQPSSPIKEVHLRPTSLRKIDHPPRDDAKEPLKVNRFVHQSPRLEPGPELKPWSRPSSPKKEEPKREIKEVKEDPKKDEPEELKQEDVKQEIVKQEDAKQEIVKQEDAKQEDVQQEDVQQEDTQLPEESEPLDEPKPLEEPELSEEAKPLEETKPSEDPEKLEEALPPKLEPDTPPEAPSPTNEAPSPAATKPVLSRFAKDVPRTMPVPKPKPEMPPKNDFRATLRSRNQSTDLSKTDAPKSEAVSELQNVFGKLRKTETKNFVAPDVLKDNILRGKKSLNLTGGPKPTVRRDEFRESLISTKTTMLAKASEEGSTLRRSDSISRPAETPEAIAAQNRLSRSKSFSKAPIPELAPKEKQTTPEAIAAQNRLSRSKSFSKAPIPEPAPKKQTTPEAIARKKSLRGAERPTLDDKPLQSPVFTKKDSAKPGKLADRFNPALAGMLARGPPPAASKSPSNGEGGASPSRPAQEESSKPAPELQHMTKGRARGPKRRNPAAKQAVAEPERIPENIPEKVDATATVAAAPPAELKQDPPSSTPSDTNGTPEEPPVISRVPTRDSMTEKPLTPAKPRQLSAKFDNMSSPELPKKPEDLNRRVSGLQETPKHSPRLEPIATPKFESPEIPKRSSAVDSDRRSSSSLSFQRSPQPESARTSRVSSPSLPKKPAALEEKSPEANGPAQTPRSESVSSPNPASLSPVALQSRFSRPLPTPPARTSVESPKPSVLKSISSPNPETPPPRDQPSPEKPSFSVKNATALWGRNSASSSPVLGRARSPIKLPTKTDEQAAMKDAGLVRSPESTPRPDSYSSKPLPVAPAQPKQKPAGLGFNLPSLGGLGGLGGLVASRSRDSNPSPSPSKDLPLSPPGSAGISRPDSLKASSAPPASPAPKNDGLFAEFFDEAPVTEGRLPENIDTVHILKTPPFDLGPTGKIRTLRKQMQEVTGDGRLHQISMQEEHVLFQESMYLCTHVYEDSKVAKSTDVYLWAGNNVPESTIEDAQVFAKNHAKQTQGRLLVIRQGNEPPNFFDALGGIVITRRGAKPASKQYMLCGRRHLGHLAFDEVDFSLNSFCSAYPYLISTAAGKVYLWKGRGCSAEELSGARLMGMDLAPTGDFEEIAEGSEPSSLIAVFPPSTAKGPAIPRSADHWRYKATSERYRARLFKMEQHSAVAGWGQSLQVGSFFATLRRPSWATLSPTSPGPIAEPGPQTPLTPKSPVNAAPTTKVVELMPFCQRDLEPENIYVLDAFFELYMYVITCPVLYSFVSLSNTVAASLARWPAAKRRHLAPRSCLRRSTAFLPSRRRTGRLCP